MSNSIKLFKRVPFDGVNAFPYFYHPSDLDTYLNTVTDYTAEIDFIRIGDDILINKSYNEAIEYGYGALIIGNRTYFITVTDVKVTKNTAVYLSYTVDWVTTLRYEQRLQFGRSHLIKSTDAYPNKCDQAIQPSDMRVTNVYPITSSDYLESDPLGWGGDALQTYLIISYINKEGAHKVVTSPLSDGYHAVPLLIDDVYYSSLDLYDIDIGIVTDCLGIAPQDVTGMWVSPIQPHGGLTNGDATRQTHGDTKRYWYELLGFASDVEYNLVHRLRGFDLAADHMTEYYITDNMNNILYKLPIGRKLIGIDCMVRTSYSAAYAYFILHFEGGMLNDVYDVTDLASMALESSTFTVACPTVDYLNDTYKNWSTGLKEIEITERKIQRNKALTQGIGGSALTGALGSTAGTPGAALGLAGGLGSAFLSYGVDTYYESEVNEIEDARYRAQPDTVIPGIYMIPFASAVSLRIIEVSAVPDDVTRYEAEINGFGARCNIPAEAWVPRPGAYKFADVEILADVPYNIKQTIKAKFQNGIKFIDIRGE